MIHLSVEINTPSPYYLLQKERQPPCVIVISDPQSTKWCENEDHTKILSSHGCDSKIYSAKSLTPRPTPEVASVGSMIDVGCRFKFIKLGPMTNEYLKLSWNKISELPTPSDSTIVASGHELDVSLLGSLNFSSLSLHMVKILVVTVRETSQYEYLKIAVGDGIGSIYNLIQLLRKFTNFENILLLNGKDNGIRHALYIGKRNEYVSFHSKQEILLNSSLVGTALLANISHGYTIKEATYGAIEFVQNAIILGTSSSPNLLYRQTLPISRMFKDEGFTGTNILQPITSKVEKPIVENFFRYLTEHPLVKPSWETYIHHDFVRQVSDNTLPISKFKYFVEQDYAYLVDYGRIYCIAASKAPDIYDMEEEVNILRLIRENGLNPHINRLKTIMGEFDDTYLDDLKRGPALRNYLRYLTEFAQNGTWCELMAALTPCMMGYCVAAHLRVENMTAPEGSLYHDWIKIYSDIYDEGMELGYKFINLMYETSSGEDIEKLVKIWGEVCALETQFWDAALNYQGK